MQCERCNRKKVTVFYRESINGRTRAYRLCNDCASLMQQTRELEELSYALTSFFPSRPSKWAEPEKLRPPIFTASNAVSNEKACPLCGITKDEAERTGRLGCSVCYRTFENLMTQRYNEEGLFSGNPPRHWRAKQEKEASVRIWREQLRDAVAAEEYEAAATLRDRIRQADNEKEGEKNGMV